MLASRGFAVGRVDGTMVARARARQLEPVRRAAQAGGDEDPTWLITNCRVLSEGVDLPAVDLVVFADAKQSHVDILQCMGRASRLAPGKEFGYVGWLRCLSRDDHQSHMFMFDPRSAGDGSQSGTLFCVFCDRSKDKGYLTRANPLPSAHNSAAVHCLPAQTATSLSSRG